MTADRAEQAEDMAASAFCLGADAATVAAIIAQAEAGTHAAWMLSTARIFLDLGMTPDEMRGWARHDGYEFLTEIADAMKQLPAHNRQRPRNPRTEP